MSSLLHPSRPADSLPASGGLDSTSDSAILAGSLGARLEPSRWIGWRLRLLVAAALLGCLGIFVVARLLAQMPALHAEWGGGVQGRVLLAASAEPALRGHEGSILAAVGGVAVDPAALLRSGRWLVGDGERRRHAALHDALAVELDGSSARLRFADGFETGVPLAPRGFGALGLMFWLMSAFALALYLVAMVVLLARPRGSTLAYAAMALCQAGSLELVAVESVFELALPAGFAAHGIALRSAFDLATGAAAVQAAALHPRRLPGAAAIAAGGWALAAAFALALAGGLVANAWAWTQALGIALGLASIGLFSWSYRLEPHPFAIVMRRFGVASLGTWLLLTAAVAAAARRPELQVQFAAIGPVIWAVFLGSLLLVVPFLARSQQVVREFSMLAGVSTVATSLDLLFVAVFSLGPFASLTLALFVALGVYAGMRQWILNQMLGSSMLTAERMFEQLYRIARDVEARPEQLAPLLTRLLRELFEPLELVGLERAPRGSRVVADGSTLIVPLPDLGAPLDGAPRALAVRFAQRGRRLFTPEDARLTDRVVEQLKRAVAHDRAVEQGRSEERARLAQDLHDDIGARLLTLMYKAPSPEMEDYVRHTLQDLKTLTRGLAAPTHRLSHAVAEWKADITHRLAAAQCELGWAVTYDQDAMLSVVQWSAMTRVLRELVSNAIAHAHATRVDIGICVERDRLDLTVADDGIGRDPKAWSHGLGLGGVRKRVKQLGGEVEWRENLGQGITCHVRVSRLSERH